MGEKKRCLLLAPPKSPPAASLGNCAALRRRIASAPPDAKKPVRAGRARLCWDLGSSPVFNRLRGGLNERMRLPHWAPKIEALEEFRTSRNPSFFRREKEGEKEKGGDSFTSRSVSLSNICATLSRKANREGDANPSLRLSVAKIKTREPVYCRRGEPSLRGRLPSCHLAVPKLRRRARRNRDLLQRAPRRETEKKVQEWEEGGFQPCPTPGSFSTRKTGWGWWKR